MALRDVRQCRAHLHPYFPADSLIHLVEHQCRDGIVLHQNHLERKHQAGQLATGGYPSERLGLQSRVELDHQLYAPLTMRPSLRYWDEHHHELSPWESKLRE